MKTKKSLRTSKANRPLIHEEEGQRVTRPDVTTMPVQDLRKFVHELQLQQVKLEVENNELRRAHLESQATCEQHANFYDFSPVGYLTLDTQGRILECNHKAARLLERDRETIIGQPLTSFIAQHDQATIQQHYQNVISTGRQQVCEAQIQAEDPSRWLYVNSLAARRPAGSMTRVLTVLQDISDRKRTVEAFRLAKFSFDRTSTALYWIGAEARILNVNEAASSMLGYSKDELCAMTVLDLSPKDQTDQWPRFWMDTAGCESLVLLTSHRAKDGRLIPVEMTVKYLSQEGKDYHCAFVRDITEQRQASSEIAQLAERLELAAGSAQIGVWDYYIPQNRLLWDDRMCALYGVSKEDFSHSYDAWLCLVHPEDRARCHDAIQQASRNEQPYDIDFRVCGPGKTVRVIKAYGKVTWDSEGTPLRMTGISYDISERRRNEVELRATKEQLHQALIASNTGLWELNTDTDQLFLSKEWKAQLGYAESELASDYSTWESLLHADDREKACHYIRTYLKHRTGDYRQEFRLKHKDGSYRWIEASASFIAEPDGRRVRLLGIHSDITERKKLEAQFRQAQKMEAVGRFSASVAHDFNNLLTVMNGYCSILADRLPAEEPLRIMAKEALKAGERAASLTGQLLAFSRRQVLRIEPINLNDSIRSISTMLIRLIGSDVTLTLDLAPELQAIGADKGQFDQVMMNLVVNARDAMPEGGELSIATGHTLITPESPDANGVMPPGRYVYVRVSDTGSGMSADTMAHIFEPFFTTKELGKGTGLGLATVYGIVKQCQGYIFVESELGRGTTFHLYYPPIAATQAVAEVPTVRQTSGSETLLVVEDQDAVRSLLVGVLIQQGYRVIEAAKGEDALRIVAAAQSEPIQALVTELVMPRISGQTLADRLRSVLPNIRVLFLSNQGETTDKPLREDPGTAYLPKPFLPVDLSRRLRDLLDKKI